MTGRIKTAGSALSTTMTRLVAVLSAALLLTSCATPRAEATPTEPTIAAVSLTFVQSDAADRAFVSGFRAILPEASGWTNDVILQAGADLCGMMIDRGEDEYREYLVNLAQGERTKAVQNAMLDLTLATVCVD